MAAISCGAGELCFFKRQGLPTLIKSPQYYCWVCKLPFHGGSCGRPLEEEEWQPSQSLGGQQQQHPSMRGSPPEVQDVFVICRLCDSVKGGISDSGNDDGKGGMQPTRNHNTNIIKSEDSCSMNRMNVDESDKAKNTNLQKEIMCMAGATHDGFENEDDDGDGDHDVEEEFDEEEDNEDLSRKRKRYTIDFKCSVVESVQNGGMTVAAVAREHQLPQQTVRDWVQNKNYLTTAKNQNRGSLKARPGRLLTKINDALFEYYERNSRLPVTMRKKLSKTALVACAQEAKKIILDEHARSPCLSTMELNTMQKFSASVSWLKKFARRHGWKGLAMFDDKPDQFDRTSIEMRIHELRHIISLFRPENVFKMDETILYYKLLPCNSYVVDKDGKQVLQQHLMKASDRILLYICANEDGSAKVPLAVVGSHPHPSCFVAQPQRLLPYFDQPHAWSDAGTLQRWFQFFLEQIRQYTNEHILLIVRYYDRSVELYDQQEQVRVEMLPPMPDETRKPIDVGIAHTVKQDYRFRLLREVMALYPEREARRRVALSAKMNPAAQGLRQGYLPHIEDALRILKEVWDETTDVTIQNCWRNQLYRAELDAAPDTIFARLGKLDGTTTNRASLKGISALDSATTELLTNVVEFAGKDFETQHASSADSARGVQRVHSLDDMVEQCVETLLAPCEGQAGSIAEMSDLIEQWVVLEESKAIRELLAIEASESMNMRSILGFCKLTAPDGNIASRAEGGVGRVTNSKWLSHGLRDQDGLLEKRNPIMVRHDDKHEDQVEDLQRREARQANDAEIEDILSKLLEASFHLSELGEEYRTTGVLVRDICEQIWTTRRLELTKLHEGIAEDGTNVEL